jgi:hypothetical protein
LLPEPQKIFEAANTRKLGSFELGKVGLVCVNSKAALATQLQELYLDLHSVFHVGVHYPLALFFRGAQFDFEILRW